MTITIERLRQTFSEGGAQEIYQAVKAEGDFLGFAKQYVFSQEERVARSTLWGLTKASKQELSQLQVILDEIIDLAMHTESSSIRRLSLNIVERLDLKGRSSENHPEAIEDGQVTSSIIHRPTVTEDDLRTDFLDFCLDHMADIKEFPAIQSICMKLAFRMCRFYPELMEELIRVLQAMEIEYYKPAVKGVRNKILSGKLK